MTGGDDEEIDENSNVRGRMPCRVMIAMTIMLPLFGNRVVTTAPPRLTAGDAFQPKPGSATGAVKIHRLKKILGTSRREATTAAGPADGMDHGRQELLVAANEKTDQGFHGAPSGLPTWRMPARLAERLQSSCSSSRVASEARHRAMVTIQ